MQRMKGDTEVMAIQIGDGRESLVPTPAVPPAPASVPASLSEADRRKAELLTFASSIQVTDQPSFELATKIRQDVRKVRDHYEELLRPGIREADALHTRLLANLKSKTAELDKVDKLLKTEQDRYQEEIRRRDLAEKARAEALMREARERILAEQLSRAAEAEDTTQLGAVMERMAEPPPVLPMVRRPVKAEGASARTIPTFELLDPARIDPMWLLRMVLEEIQRKGNSVWLEQQLRREVERSREGAEGIVGRGSIRYEEKISTGVRR